MRLLKCVLATGLCWGLSCASQVYAQRADDPIQLTADFNEAGDLVVKAEKRRLGTYSAAIDFQNVQNLTVPSRYRVAIRSSGPLIVLKSRGYSQSTHCGWKSVFVLGDRSAKPDTSFIYRLPFSPARGATEVRFAQEDKSLFFHTAPPKNWAAFCFFLNRGDTVYAIRKGLVVEIKEQGTSETGKPGVVYTSDHNYVQVEHADGTIATYNVLEPGSVCVKLGDTVYPDTPLALVGSFDGTQYRVALTLHYITDRIFAKGNAYSYEHAFESVFINPVFATADGNRMLVSQNRYTAVVAPELITKEMTKREMKARTEK